MRIRNIKNKKEILENSCFVLDNPFEYKGKWNKVFLNDNPIHLEIGTGKCKFICQMAKKYPDINFIGIERCDSVLALGIKNINEELPNLRLMNVDALKLNEVFDKEISCIYLNFSDPWPKKRTAKRRLTSSIFLNIYKDIFKNKQVIIQKTDNRKLFEYSLMSFSINNFLIKDISLDLHKDEKDDNINTEYEDKFVKLGFPIYMVKVEK